MTKRLLAGWTLGLLAQLSAIGLLLTSAWLIARAAEHPPVLYLMVAIVSVRAFGIARSVLHYGERLLTHDAAFRLMNDHRLALYVALDNAAPLGLPQGRRGDVVNRVVRDVDALQDRLLRVRIPRSIAFAAATMVTVLMAFIDMPTALVLAAAILALFAGIPLLVALSKVGDNTNTSILRGELATEVAAAVVAAPDLIAYAATGPVREKVRKIDLNLARTQRRFVWFSGLNSAIVLTAMGAVVMMAARIGVPAVADGRLDRVLLAVLILAPLALIEPLDQLGTIAQTSLRVKDSLVRVREIQSVRPPLEDSPAWLELPKRWDLRVLNLLVGWSDGAVAPPVTFALGHGEVLGIAGPSGSGKSTLARTLLGLIGPKGGLIELGGADTRQMRGEDIRSRIGLMEQDAHIFNTSIRENLRIGKPDATALELETALARAGIRDFVHTLPDGLDSVVGENGSRLSGGERQRLALARLLLADRRVLILDEPTEHLDELTATALLDDILGLAGDHSIIVISHSHDVLERLDHVVWLGQNALVNA